MFSCEFCKIFNNSFFHRMPLVAASVVTTNIGNNKAGARIGLHCPYKYVLPCYFTMYDIYKYVFLYVCMYSSVSIYLKTILILQNTEKKPSEVFCKKRCSLKFRKIQKKMPAPSLFFNKVIVLKPATLLKKRPWYSCFPVNFAKFLKTPVLQNTSGQLLLNKQRKSK